MIFRRWSVVLACAALVGCGSHSKNEGDPESDEPIAECEAFAAAYAGCLGTLGPQRIAVARVEQTRAGIAAQNAHSGSGREALRKQCASNLLQLSETCL